MIKLRGNAEVQFGNTGFVKPAHSDDFNLACYPYNDDSRWRLGPQCFSARAECVYRVETPSAFAELEKSTAGQRQHAGGVQHQRGNRGIRCLEALLQRERDRAAMEKRNVTAGKSTQLAIFLLIVISGGSLRR